MARYSRMHGLPAGSGPGLFFMMTLGLSATAATSAFASQIDCERVRTGTESIRFTMENTAETEVKKPPEHITYTDVVRNSPEGVLLFTYAGDIRFKAVLTRSLLPLSYEMVGKGAPQTFTYDTDTSTFALKPGTTFKANVVESTPGSTVNTYARHEYAISDGGHFDVAGCSFPAVSVHHTIHYTRDGKDWDFILDSLVSPDLNSVLRTRRQIVAGTSKIESAIYVSVVTDLSTTADMTKAP